MKFIEGIVPRFRVVHKALDDLKAAEKLSRSDIGRIQLESINKLWNQSIKSSTYYKEMAFSLGLPAEFKSLEEFSALVPILEKEVLKRSGAHIVGINPRPGVWKNTSGSTGEPTKIYWSNKSHKENLHIQYRFWQNHDIHFLDKQAMLWGNSSSLVGSKILSRLYDLKHRVRNRLFLSAYKLNDAVMESYAARIKRMKPNFLYSYSSSAYIFALYVIKNNLDIKIPYIILSSEVVYDHYINTISTAFKAQVLIEYGSMETGVLAYTDTSGRIVFREDKFYIEYIGNGDVKELIVTPLFNEDFPLFRYRIGDSVKGIVRQNYGFDSADRVLGKSNESLISKDGNIIHSALINSIIKNSNHVGEIDMFQIVQKLDGSIDLLIKGNDYNKDSISRLSDQIAEVSGYPVTLRIVDDLMIGRSGKHIWIRSLLYAQVEKERPASNIKPRSST